MRSTRGKHRTGLGTLVFLLLALINTTLMEETTPRGPSFIIEPPLVFEFSNGSGGNIDCTGSGAPETRVKWKYKDGRLVTDIPGLRASLKNGTLSFSAFAADSYESEIHDNVYFCIVSNDIGTIVSRDVHVKAVISRPRKLKIENFGNAAGCPMVLTCKSSDEDRDHVKVQSWLQEPSLTLYPTQQTDARQHHLPTGQLYIKQLELEDRYHQYRCRGTISHGHEVFTSGIFVPHVIDYTQPLPPVLVEHSTSVSVRQNEDVTLFCLVNACPEAIISWSTVVDGTPLLVQPDNRIRPTGPLLTIKKAAPSDAGTYRCKASNRAGEITVDMKLSVTIPLLVEMQPSMVSVPVGSSTSFQCQINSFSNFLYKITWYKDGQLLATSDDYQNIYHLASVKREDKGMYQCVVQASNGEMNSAVAELKLGDAQPSIIYAFIEQTVQPGPSISLKCSASGNPPPNIIWKLDGFEVNHSSRLTIGQYLNDHGDVISHVNYTTTMIADGGEYSCIAINRAGSVEHAARLNVYGPPIIREFPHVIAIAGGTFVLKCPVGGYPLERVYWERGSKELPDDLRHKVNENGVLTITDVVKTDAGGYTCWVRSKLGDIATKSTELEVIAPPKLSPFQSTPMILNVGERASLTCSVVHGDPPFDFHWRINGVKLSPGDAVNFIQLDKFTNVLTIQSLEPENSGNYSCYVQNRAIEVTQTRSIEVNVPPNIEPFNFQEGLAAGARTRLLCGVSGADLPLSLNWLKDGLPITSHVAEISAVDPYSSLLSFPSLESRHSGRYTCTANNSGGGVSYSADLLVKVPPRWEIEPIDTNALRGQTVSIDCKAYAVPPANTSWKIGLGGKSGEFVEIMDRPNLRVMDNGSLIIHQAMENSQGYYLCQAQNGIGSGVGKVIKFQINSPPFFTQPANPVKVKRGDTARLVCFVSGDTPLTVRWFIGAKMISSGKAYRVNSTREIPQNLIKSELAIINVDGKDSGMYACQGNNVFGSEKQMIQLIVQEPPNPPYSLQVTEINSDSVRLDWQINYKGDFNDLSKFIIEYREEFREWQKMEILSRPLSHLTYVRNLKPATIYKFRVMAGSSAGISLPSLEAVAKTEQQIPSGPPIQIIVKPTSPTTISVKWNQPYRELRHGDITGYILYVINVTNADFLNYSIPAGIGENFVEYKLSGLAKYTKYIIRVQAANKKGLGPASEPFAVQTMEDIPTAAPTGIHCISITPQSLHVYWTPPSEEHRNGRIAGYKLTYEAVVEDDDEENYKDYQPVTLDVDQSSKIVNSLHKYTNYSFHVLAYTSVGEGPASLPKICPTDEDVPESPKDIKVIPTASHTLFVLWLPPNELNGIITRYNLYTRIVKNKIEVDHQRLQIASNSTSYEFANLPFMVEHQFWITASTKTGEGKSSKVTSITLTGEVFPRILAFGVELLKPWRGSTALKCPAIGFIHRVWKKNNRIVSQALNLQLSHTGNLFLNSLQPRDAGNYTCEVHNDTVYDSITYLLYIQGPPLPPSPYKKLSSNESVVVGWTHTLRKGDAPIQDFTLRVQKAQATVENAKLSRFTNTYEIKNLKCGTKYEISMTAVNKIGESDESDFFDVATDGRSPTAPGKEAFIKPNISSVVLDFHVWNDNGCPIIDVMIMYKRSKETLWKTEIKGTKKIELLDLIPSTRYALHIEVENDAGSTSHDFFFYTLNLNGEITPAGFEETFEDFFQFEFKYLIYILIALIVGIVIFVLLIICITSAKHCNHNVRTINEDIDQNDGNLVTMRSELGGHNETINASRIFIPHPSASKNFKTILKFESSNVIDEDIIEKVPETSDDISPYATFHLPDNHGPRRVRTRDISQLPNHHIDHHLRPIDNPHTVLYHEQLNNGQRKERKPMPPNRRFVSVDSESEDELDSSLADSTRNTLVLKPSRSYECIGNDFTFSSTSSEMSSCDIQKTFPRKNRARKLSTVVAETHFGAEPPKEVIRPEAIRVTPGPSSQAHKPISRSNDPKSKSKTQTDFSIAV